MIKFLENKMIVDPQDLDSIEFVERGHDILRKCETYIQQRNEDVKLRIKIATAEKETLESLHNQMSNTEQKGLTTKLQKKCGKIKELDAELEGIALMPMRVLDGLESLIEAEKSKVSVKTQWKSAPIQNHSSQEAQLKIDEQQSLINQLEI